MSSKLCKGISYKISGKNYCVREKKTKVRRKTRTYFKKTNRIRRHRRNKKTRKNVAEVQEKMIIMI
jgi:hypothetical protein